MSWPARQEALEGFSNWRITGKLAVIQPERRDSLVINQWRQINNAFNIHVSSGLLGLGATHISGTPQKLLLQQSDEPPLQSFDPTGLLNTTLGWSLPLDYLSYWIKGLPKPDTPAKLSFDDKGNPFQIGQNNWLVQLDRYRPAAGLILPGKVTLTKGEVKLKVFITNWTKVCGNCQ